MASRKDQDLPSLSFVLVKGYPRAWQELWEPVYSLSRNFGVDINTALEAFKLVYECVSKQEEGRPLSTGFLIGDPEKIRQRLPDFVGVELEKRSIFDLTKTVSSLFGMIDGYTSAFVVGKDGTPEGARLMPADLQNPSRAASLTSSSTDTATHPKAFQATP